MESLDRLIEDELIDLERYEDLEDFLRKGTIYQHHFNFARPIGYKGKRTPWEIVLNDHHEIQPAIWHSRLSCSRRNASARRWCQDAPELVDAIAPAHIDPPPRDVELVCFGRVGRERLWKVWDQLFDSGGVRTPKRRRRGRRRFVSEVPEDPIQM